VSANVTEVRKPGSEIDRSGVCGKSRHHAENICTIRRSKSSHSDTTCHRGIGKASIAPTDETGIISCKELTKEACCINKIPPQQEDGTVPEILVRMGGAKRGEMSFDQVSVCVGPT